MKLSKPLYLLFLFPLFASMLSCTPKQIASDITSQIFKAGSPAFEMESDVEIAEISGLTMMKMLKYKWVDEAKVDVNLNRAKTFYSRGKDFGLQILNRNSAFEQNLNKDLDSFKKALHGMGRGYAPALFWTAFNWGSYINLNKDSPLAIAEYPKVEAMMNRVVELDEFYFYGGPHLFFGVSYGSRPKMFGGDPDKSKAHFEKVMNTYNHKILMANVLYAQYTAVQNQDRALFDLLLNKVESTNADVMPEQRLANELAKLRARWLLEHASGMF